MTEYTATTAQTAAAAKEFTGELDVAATTDPVFRGVLCEHRGIYNSVVAQAKEILAAMRAAGVPLTIPNRVTLQAALRMDLNAQRCNHRLRADDLTADQRTELQGKFAWSCERKLQLIRELFATAPAKPVDETAAFLASLKYGDFGGGAP